MSNASKIKKYLKINKEVTPKELTEFLNISSRATFKNLAKLLNNGEIKKKGKAPKVWYTLSSKKEEDKIKVRFTKNEKEVIKRNFLYITPLGEEFKGLKGFLKWCKTRNLDPKEYAKKYIGIQKQVTAIKLFGVIDGTPKIRKTFKKEELDKVFYIDFYSIPVFGKTKLGQMLLYAKQSQDKKRIKEIALNIKNTVTNLIARHKIDAVGFIPPTVKREVQIMKELERYLQLKIPKISLTKIKTGIIIPQKTLKKLNDRILNAKNTIFTDEGGVYTNVLLIDDAVGSGATLNETAKKLKERGTAKKVFGLAITGSYKGFEVISEI